jgi:uncharacterized protein
MEDQLPLAAVSEPVLEVVLAEPVPPRTERLPALDLIRGVAILGIVLVNIDFFMAPTEGMEPKVPVTWWGDRVAAALTMFFAQGKMISQLAILFGAGLALQADRARAAGRPFAGYYIRRQALLFFIGLAHALLLWYGDILASYAIVGMGALLLSRLGQRGLLWCVAGLLLWVYGRAVVGTILAAVFGGEAALATARGEQPAAAATALDETPNRFGEISRTLKQHTGKDSETRIYQCGTWGEMVINRVLNLAMYVAIFWFIVAWLVLACFLLGIYLLRRGVFHDVNAHRPFLLRLTAFGLGAGVPLHVAAVGAYVWNPDGWIHNIFSQLGALPLALGYVGLTVLWANSGRARWLQSTLQAVGRMALTNYLLQSVICGFVFYSYGLAWFGTMGHAAGLLVVFAVWLFELCLSPVWLRHFEMGPVEWLWRSLADGRVRPFVRRATVPSV